MVSAGTARAAVAGNLAGRLLTAATTIGRCRPNERKRQVEDQKGDIMKTTSVACAFAMLTAISAVPALAALSSSDRTFATEAAQGGLAEVELGQLALQRGTSPQVKQFAQRMVTDHTQANQDLMQAAKSENLDLPTQVDAQQKSEMDRLRGMSGSAFDTAYMQHMLQDHRKDIAEFQKEAQSGRDPALKGFAQKYLPTLQQHLQLAQSTASKG
jgi:putative membrane protein